MHNENYAEAKKLFDLGVICAYQYRCNEAIEHYTKSLRFYNSPAPLINRANILGKRVRHYEALQDLLEAKRLDQNQGNEFSSQIDREIIFSRLVTHHYSTGVRDKLIAYLEENGHSNTADKIVCLSFKTHPSQWENNTYGNKFLEHHYFNEIDNIAKFEDRAYYPDTSEEMGAYPYEFIQKKLTEFLNHEKYRECEIRLHSLLCSYDDEDMRRIRDNIIYKIHSHLLDRDYCGDSMSIYSECEGRTKEAEEFISSRQQ